MVIRVIILFIAFIGCLRPGAGQTLDSAHKLYRSGYDFEMKKDYASAISDYYRALLIYKKLGSEEFEAKITEQLGISLFQLRQYENAIVYYDKAIDIRRSLNLNFSVAQSQFNKALALMKLGRYQAAGTEFINALYGFRIANNNGYEAWVYHNLAEMYSAMEKFDSTRSYLNKEIEIAKRLNDSSSVARAIHQVGRSYVAQKQWQAALDYFNDALKLKTAMKDSTAMVITLTSIADTYENIDKSQAITYYLKANSLTNQTAIGNEPGYHIYERLAVLLNEQEDYETALVYSMKANKLNKVLRDNQNKVEKEKRFYEGQLALLELEQFEQKKENKRNTYFLLWIFGGILSIVAFVAVLYYSRARKGKKSLYKLKAILAK